MSETIKNILLGLTGGTSIIFGYFAIINFNKIKKLKKNTQKNLDKINVLSKQELDLKSKIIQLNEELENYNAKELNMDNAMKLSQEDLIERTKGLTEIKNTAEDQANNLVKQYQDVEEINSQVIKCDEYSNKSNEAVETIYTVWGNNQKNFTAKDESLNEVLNAFDKIYSSINQIKEFSNVILEISNRTNMLALNAQIESARAGEHGKGFSVVANEIKKLSDNTKENAQAIKTSLETFYTYVYNCKDKMKELTGIEKSNNEQLQLLGNSFVTMKECIKNTKKSIKIIVQKIQSLTDNTQILAGNSEEFSAMANTLLESVKQFGYDMTGRYLNISNFISRCNRNNLEISKNTLKIINDFKSNHSEELAKLQDE